VSEIMFQGFNPVRLFAPHGNRDYPAGESPHMMDWN